MDIKFNLTNFEDSRKYGLTGVLTELASFMSHQIALGNRVIIERRYSNSPPDTVVTLQSEKDLKEFMEKFRVP